MSSIADNRVTVCPAVAETGAFAAIMSPPVRAPALMTARHSMVKVKKNIPGTDT
jgi:hypothetical protein